MHTPHTRQTPPHRAVDGYPQLMVYNVRTAYYTPYRHGDKGFTESAIMEFINLVENSKLPVGTIIIIIIIIISCDSCFAVRRWSNAFRKSATLLQTGVFNDTGKPPPHTHTHTHTHTCIHTPTHTPTPSQGTLTHHPYIGAAAGFSLMGVVVFYIVLACQSFTKRTKVPRPSRVRARAIANHHDNATLRHRTNHHHSNSDNQSESSEEEEHLKDK